MCLCTFLWPTVAYLFIKYDVVADFSGLYNNAARGVNIYLTAVFHLIWSVGNFFSIFHIVILFFKCFILFLILQYFCYFFYHFSFRLCRPQLAHCIVVIGCGCPLQIGVEKIFLLTIIVDSWLPVSKIIKKRKNPNNKIAYIFIYAYKKACACVRCA